MAMQGMPRIPKQENTSVVASSLGDTFLLTLNNLSTEGRNKDRSLGTE
jgi:hypothetical protein